MIIGAIDRLSYLVIENREVHRQVSLNDLIWKISRINKKTIHLGYDIHAGFNFPDNSGLAQVIKVSSKSFIVEPTIIDEREQSGKNPFSPTQVYIEINGKPQRMRVSNSSSGYVSQLKVDIGKIESAYRELSEGLYQETVRPFLEEVKNVSPESLGEFLKLMHQLVIKRQLEDLPNIVLSDIRFDKYNPQRGYTEHREFSHDHQEVLYIGLFKSFDYVLEKFMKTRERESLKENPKLVITPEVSKTYFRR